MRLSRRASWLLIAFAIWSWIIWVTLIKNINADPRSWNGNHPTGFLMIHVCLAIVSLVMGTAIGWLGWKGLRALKLSADGGAAEAVEAREPHREKV
jgi:hypothetical protein